MEKYFVRELETKSGKVLKINQSEIGDVGCVVWDAAIVLSTYLETSDFTDNAGQSVLCGKKVLELGSGTGVVGIQAAAQGAEVVVTDLAEFIPLMNLNIETNRCIVSGNIAAKCLKWGEDVSEYLPHPDYILMADCIYYEESIKPLIKTLCDLCGPNTAIFCCYEQRTEGKNPETEKKFFEYLHKFFTKEEIPMERQDPIYRCEEIKILKLKRNL